MIATEGPEGSCDPAHGGRRGVPGELLGRQASMGQHAVRASATAPEPGTRPRNLSLGLGPGPLFPPNRASADSGRPGRGGRPSARAAAHAETRRGSGRPRRRSAHATHRADDQCGDSRRADRRDGASACSPSSLTSSTRVRCNRPGRPGPSSALGLSPALRPMPLRRSPCASARPFAVPASPGGRAPGGDGSATRSGFEPRGRRRSPPRGRRPG